MNTNTLKTPIEKNASRGGTLKDVAARVGLSVSAVSQILNNRPGDYSSEATRERVRLVAREMGYRQRFGHKLMRGDSTKTVALLLSLPRLEYEEHIQALLTRLTEECNRAGYATYLYRLTMDAEQNSRIVRELTERGVDQFILIGPPAAHTRLTAEIEALGRTWICYGRAPGLERTVMPDVTSGCEAVLRHLIASGVGQFRVIASMGETEDGTNSRMTALSRCFPLLSGEELLRQYWHTIEIPVAAGDILADFARIGGEATDAVLDRHPGIQAIFYQSDYLAVGGIRTLYRRGIAPGRDIVVAGFNNIHAIRVSPFPAISIEHDTDATARLLFENAAGSAPVAHVVPTRMVIHNRQIQ